MPDRTMISTRVVLAYRAKPVQGLYTLLHYEAADGSWIQIPMSRLSPVIFCAGEGAAFIRGGSLKDLEPTILAHMDLKGL